MKKTKEQEIYEKGFSEGLRRGHSEGYELGQTKGYERAMADAIRILKEPSESEVFRKRGRA